MTLTKRVAGFALILVAVTTGCFGCSKPAASVRFGTAPNDVLTLTPIPQNKTPITMRTSDTMDGARIEAAIEKQFPDVEIVRKLNSSMLLDAYGGGMQDILLSGAYYEFVDAPKGAFIDLSAENFVSNYSISSLNNYAIDGKIYCLPGPMSVRGIVYDKELFEESGWEVPTSLDEFISLCETIDATGIRGFQPSLQYATAVRQLMVGFSYRDSFAGVDNYQWLRDYEMGKSTMAGHMEPGMAIMQRLLDAGVWSPQDYNVTPGERTKMMYRDHLCAMIVETQLAPVYAKNTGEGNEHELGMMPFFSGNESGSDYLLGEPSYFVGLDARLKTKGNEKRLRKAMDIVAFLSTSEGQQAITDPASPLVGSVSGTPLGNDPFFDSVRNTIAEGRVVGIPNYVGNTNSKVDTVFAAELNKFGNKETDAEQLLAACDAARDEILNGTNVGAIIGRAEKNFTVLEMSLYLAEAFRERVGAEIAFCPTNKRAQGCNTTLYAGDIYDEGRRGGFGSYLKDSFLAGKDGTTLMKIKMTGQAVIDMLSRFEGKSQSYPDQYLTAAGLKIEFAPWAGAGNRFVSVKLADGSTIEPDKIYSVATWQSVIETEQIVSVEETISDTILQVFKRQVDHDGGVIRPLTDGRFTLNWDLIAE